jgi:mannose-1-phosphate guanylyltransferase
MNALLLAAGFGTRLRPLTDHTPKCLVEIAGRPLLDYWLRDLHAAGVTRFLLNTHHLADKVEAYVSQHPLRDKIQTVYEGELLGTAGTLAANADFCAQSTTLIAHADNLCLCDWAQFFQAHANRPEGAVMTMMTFRTQTPQSCGIVEIDSRGVVQQFFEKQPTDHGNLANAAIYLIEPSVIFWLSGQPPITDISTELIPRLLGKMNTWYNERTLIDIGSPASLQSANELIQKGGPL